MNRASSFILALWVVGFLSDVYLKVPFYVWTEIAVGVFVTIGLTFWNAWAILHDREERVPL